MIEKLLDVGGQQLILPILIAIAGLYAARGLLGLHIRMAQRRKEFLELWNSDRSSDDLWLQVAIRHLYGCYLPASVIRRIMRWPDAAESLLAISELWPMLAVDVQTARVDWKSSRYERAGNIWLERILMLGSYAVLATLAFVVATASLRSEALSFTAVSYAVIAVFLGIVSLTSLARADRLNAAIKRGQKLLRRINGASENRGGIDISDRAPRKIAETPA